MMDWLYVNEFHALNVFPIFGSEKNVCALVAGIILIT